MTYDVPSQSTSTVSWWRRSISYIAALLLGFALGFLPMWAQARANTASLTEATRQAGVALMQNDLASAVVDAQRGDYESARISTSDFFIALREETSKGADSSLSQTQKDLVEPLFARRDETISLLARSDPAVAERLSDLYVSFRELLNK